MEPKRRVLPPVYFLVSLVAMLALHRLFPVVRLFGPPASFVGTVLLVVGIAIVATAAATFKRAGTPIVPFEHSTVLVTTGLYRFTRNPMYLGLVTVLLGVAVLCGTLGALLPIPVFVWTLTARFIEGEERFLEEIFGEAYASYRRRVRRWL
jgi:protein-S-isoprenylcysteine O-methyltransferase Ste14